MLNIKQIKQNVADNDAALKQASAELGALIDASPAATRTPEQAAAIKAKRDELAKFEGLAATLAADYADAMRVQDIERAIGTPPTVIVGKNRVEDKPVTMGEIMQAMAYEAPFLAHRRQNFLPNGPAEHVSLALQAAASGASSGNNESGGVLVQSTYTTALLERIQEIGRLAPKCFALPVGPGEDGIEAPFVDETSRATGSRWGGVQVYRGAEAASMTSSQPKLGEFKLRLEDLFGLFYATDRVLRDTTLLEALATKAFTSEFAFRLDDEIVRGTGSGQCAGIVGGVATVSVAKESNQVAGTVVYENIIKMHARLLARCMSGAEWYINQALLPQLNKMYLAVGTGGVPVYLPANGLSASPYGTLMGLPVNVIEQCSAPGTVGDIFLANFSNDYALIQKPMTSASSIHVLFTSNQTAFRWVWPVIGKPVMASTITPYKGADTLGPFVTLATRA